ncbi:hypothetical protein LG634_07145 [Streptomyces bambusae]|uniref:hypothetical protein n=1 Tax=Streptomyces bambusae TaxID=1550616 RepID=UPI001CFE606A|nr:hypothetical protein [Streptomyces bambusae]MCB5164609.1 hypothetical protein [Streptomyces bambusae]
MEIRNAEPTTWNPALLWEFDITSNEIRDGLIAFDADTLAFRFTPRPQTGRLECTVELREYTGGGLAGNPLLGGTETVVIEPDQTTDVWLCFAGFGWYDTAMTRPVGLCHYRVSLDGDSTVRVAVGGEDRPL